MVLNDEQSLIFEKIMNKENTLITGGGGVGKSYLVKYIIEYAENNSIKYGLTAMTGSAAVIVGGMTVHSYLGIGIGRDSAEYIVHNKIYKNKKLTEKLTKLQMLIIDEISMLNDILFTKISRILQIIKNCDEPFGGVQMILVGDLFQLPPIEGNYCFLAHDWDACGFSTFLLRQNMRQKDDMEFAEMLERLRWGNCSDADYAALLTLKKTAFPEGIIPTKLFSRNSDVNEMNVAEFNKLVGDSNVLDNSRKTRTYSIEYPTSKVKNVATKAWVKTVKMPESITLCIGAQVMVTKNIDMERGLINGTRGVVIGFGEKSVDIKLINGDIATIFYQTYKACENKLIEFSYCPLTLAWAISIHKSQGSTLDALEIDLGKNIFAHGQAYTALSRARNIKSIKLIYIHPTSFRASPAVVAFYNNL